MPICTTIEQSKRLLKAGVDIKTADMVYADLFGESKILLVRAFSEDYRLKIDNTAIPAWSLGVLWDLCGSQFIETCTADVTAEELIQILVTRLVCLNE